MLIQVGNVAACKASEQTAQGSALGFNPSKKERPIGAKAFIYLTMLLPFQGVYWRLTCTQGAALGCLLAGLTGRTITHLNRHRANNYSHSWVNYSHYSNSFPDKKHLQTIH